VPDVRAAAARVWNGGRANCTATVRAAACFPSACRATAPRAHTNTVGLATAGLAPQMYVLGPAQRTARWALWFRLPSCAAPGRPRGSSRCWHASAHQQVARVAARKVLQRVHDGQQRQVLQRVAAQDEVVAAGYRHLRVT